MKNAHLRFGTLRFHKVMRDTTLDVRLWLDRLIVEPDQEDARRGKAHLVSVFGGDQEVAAVAAAIVEQSTFDVHGPDISVLHVALGEDAEVFRGSLSVPCRKRAVRHLIAVSRELSATRPGGDTKARRTVLCSDDPAFVLYRIGARFGLPVLPKWSDWFWNELAAQKAVRRLTGLGCKPILVNGTKKRFLGWIGHGVKRGRIQIPKGMETPRWELPSQFEPPLEYGNQDTAGKEAVT